MAPNPQTVASFFYVIFNSSANHMIIKTCLLISDDPDDHIEFSEALYEVSNDAVLVTVSDMKRSIDLLLLQKCVPEFIFLNLSIADLDLKGLFQALDRPGLDGIQVVAYGEPADATEERHRGITSFLDINSSYSQLKTYLRELLGNRES